MRCLQSALIAILVSLCLMDAHKLAGQESVIHTFADDNVDGTNPDASLFIDPKGNLFGTTIYGGAKNAGTVFEVSPVAGGGWTEKVIHDFSSSAGDGFTAETTLIPDAKGNLYATTLNGGSEMEGTVFEVSPVGDGSWTERVLYSFGSSATDGSGPIGGLVFDPQGNLYGVTIGGPPGPSSVDGSVFELTPSIGGGWTEKVLYIFGATSTDGNSPQAGLAIDAAGNLYGTTYEGGTDSGGTAYELTRDGMGGWTETILHNFVPSPSGPLGYPEVSGDGANPESNLLLDNQGNLYGTTAHGTTYGSSGPSGVGDGAVFELSPSAGGAWTEKVTFLDTDQQSASNPIAGLTMDSAGNLYGTSPEGGSTFGMVNGEGSTVFEVSSTGENVLYNFPSAPADGSGIYGAGVIFGTHGNLFGVTNRRGVTGEGTVFEIEGVGPSVPVGTKTSLAASPASNLVAGEPITLTATVAAASGPAIPTGTVTFSDPAGGSVTVLLIAGQATYYGKVPPVGTYSVFASYSGGPGFAGSKSVTIGGTVTAPPRE